jgi:hypothetical protein
MNETMLIFAARYAHGRNTGGAFMVVRYILSVWDDLSNSARAVLYKESFEATFCKEDWKMLQDKFEKEAKR